jgi:integrase
MSRLTDSQIRKHLQRSRTEQESIPDGGVPGLALRIGSQNSATWTLLLRVTGEGGSSERGSQRIGRRYRVTLGKYPFVGIEAARAKATDYLHRSKGGNNPVKELEKAATAKGLTIEALAHRYVTEYVHSRQLRSAPRIESALKVHIIPSIGGELVDRLNRENVRELLGKARVHDKNRHTGRGRRSQGGVEAARTAIVVLRAMLTWAIDEELVRRHDNPASKMARNLPAKQAKERVLSLEEARAVWRAAESAGYAFGTHAQLMLLTGCRAGEWAKALWGWVDLEQGLFVIPASAYKSRHVHVVPLVSQAVEILKRIPRGRAGDFIFSSAKGAIPVKGIGKFYRTRLMREIIAERGEAFVEPFTSHDLRRTVATRLAEALGFGGEQLIRRVLGHSDGSVTAIYNRYGYVREMRACLEGWANDLLGRPAAEPEQSILPELERLPPASRPRARVDPPMQLPLLPPGTG